MQLYEPTAPIIAAVQILARDADAWPAEFHAWSKPARDGSIGYVVQARGGPASVFEGDFVALYPDGPRVYKPAEFSKTHRHVGHDAEP